MRDKMEQSYLATLLGLRMLVGFLGERAQGAWWSTAFYDASSRPFMEPVFAKTIRLAQYHGVLEAARRLHDEHLNVGSYHLFRLPEEVEQDLHSIVQSSTIDDLASRAPQNKEAALVALKRLAGTSGTGASEGPLSVGSIKDLDSTDTLEAIGAAYLSAFTKNSRMYPYLVA